MTHNYATTLTSTRHIVSGPALAGQPAPRARTRRYRRAAVAYVVHASVRVELESVLLALRLAMSPKPQLSIVMSVL
jgi:uncharacterized protein YqiB (DUF1249 family)